MARARKAAGYTQEGLADALRVDRTTVVRWERGGSEPQPYLQPKLARLLGVSPSTLAELLVVRAISVSPPAVEPSRNVVSGTELLAGLRHAMIGRGPQVEELGAVPLDQAIRRAHRLYQHADYEAAARFLPNVLPRIDDQPAGRATATRRAGGYIVAAKLATKLGDATLAWIAADRARQAAEESAVVSLIGVAGYQVACALVRNGHLADARAVAETSAGDVLAASRSVDTQPVVSARGSLLLLSAVLAARSGDAAGAQHLLRRARDLASVLGGDGNWLWTGFGPTNVAIHELSVAVQLGDTKHALAQGAYIDVDRLPSVLVGRRSQVHIDLSRAATDAHDDSLAVLHLLEAERVAKQSVSRNVNARTIISTLLTREHRGATPGLRAMAERVGLAHG